MNVVVNGLMTSYQKTGSGKVIVCLHGWGDNSKTFSLLESELQVRYKVLTLDLPGIGHSQAPEIAWSLGNYAEFVRDWLGKIGIEDVYAIIGHSNGGAIAMHGVAKNVLKPQKLVLLASAGVRNNHKLRRKLLKAASKTGKLITAPLPRPTRIKIRNRFYKGIGSDIGLFPHMEETFRKIVTEDTQSDAKNIKVPTLLIYGDNDKATPSSYGRTFHDLIKGSKLETLQAGHFLHQEQPQAVAELISDFLEKG